MLCQQSCRRLLTGAVAQLLACRSPALAAGMSKTVRKIISTAKAAPPVSAYSQAVCVDNMVYVSGTIGVDKDTKKLADNGVVGQARAAFTNLGNILEAAGSSFGKVVKVTILLDDINDFAAVGDVYKEFFKEPYPARISYQAAKLPLAAKIEVDAIAVAGDMETIQ
ncbi:2-iminobutanoate/2-iminopropanoate deaminase-like [Schistocerca piceifrons]|uniref:2-iminobutanoate/2-iminopropanoate deaminase-like n=1 Tax=Schistocerca piceifrons TaxID=274613 RepID=UPI001F5ED081|nr:2-iminobutanoate/2-iminopropanoate deaminase-like [Schistocerca piceifrons]XP_049778710.1 2-iminobutanoate/2-iminopropanoate deaminase-like [Schistocerca cancellata]